MISCLWSVVYSEHPAQIFSLCVHPCPSVVEFLCGESRKFHERNAGRAPPAPDLLAPYASPSNRPGPATTASTTLVAPLVLTLVLAPVVRLFVSLEVASLVALGEISRMTVVAIVRQRAISTAVLSVVVTGFPTVVRPGAGAAVELALRPASVFMRAV